MTRYVLKGKLWLLGFALTLGLILAAVVPALGSGNSAHAGIYPCSGDVDGKNGITITDAFLIAQGEVGLITKVDCDVDGANGTTITDAFLISQHVVGLITL